MDRIEDAACAVRRALRAALSAVLLALPAAANEAGPLAASVHPGVGQGDFEFYVDAAARQRAGAGKAVTRILVQLPVRAVLEQTDANAANLRIHVKAYDADRAIAALAAQEAELRDQGREREAQDRRVYEALEDLEDIVVLAETESRARIEVAAREALDDTDYQLFELPLEMEPGDYALEIGVENLSQSKKGLLDRLRKRPLSSTARMLFRVPDLHQELALADPIFQSGYGKHTEYASRVYGLLNDSLHVSTQLFGQGPCTVNLVARDRAGEVHWRDSLTVDVAGNAAVDFHASVNAFPAGQYVLVLTAADGTRASTATRSFDVAWSLTSWRKSHRDLSLEAEIVLSERQYEDYEHLPLGEKERFMERFWARQDPTPETAYNEVLEEFHRRVAHADIHYSESIRGALSDRGKIYIRLGPPAEVQSEAVASHLAGQGTEDLIGKVDDPYTASEHSPTQEGFEGTGGTLGRERAQQRQRQVDQHSLVVGRARELVSYELWIYTGGGEPLLLADESIAVDTGLRLLFLDNQGFGDYQLRKSSAQLDIHGLRATF